MSRIKVDVKPDHIHGNFEWETEPSCKCGQLAQAIEDKMFFVCNVTDFGANKLYMLPLHDDGFLRHSDGVEIAYCPWCGEKMIGKKKYDQPAKSSQLTAI